MGTDPPKYDFTLDWAITQQRDVPRGGRAVYHRLNPRAVAYSIRITK